MKDWLEGFAKDEDGAITVDWVVLTALILGVQIVLLMTPIRDNLVSVSEAIGEQVGLYGDQLQD
ncbi:Flp family type IVb pilin [Xinfangfangia pollutisoli]|uniref:Flp family type IVb pilin n=1 Tax=Xinfangfangia pollutisoli TaxID=2865960 RepID=UPI001CD496C4|nr:hypothetical protein [Xinfangfangia pollutisoli]